jgi:hypothetical protein
VATLNRVAQVSDLVVQGGQATISGRFLAGRSRLRVESGQLTVRVDSDSDVTIHADSRVGHISWDTGAQPVDSEFVVGDGHAHLDIGVVVGQASVRLGGADETARAER